MLTLTQIIEEVDALVPNSFDVDKKILWLNELNKEFFEVVQIPLIHQFASVAGKKVYSIDPKIRSNKVDAVRVAQTFYQSMQYEDVGPGHNFWVIDDETQELILEPVTPIDGQLGVVKYTKVPQTTFVKTELTVTPDAPPEYHWVYVLGMCERTAKAMNDVSLANNYAVDYRNQLSLAQQNFHTRRGEGQ